MLKRTLVLSLAIASTFASAATLTDKQQKNIDDINAQLQQVEATAASNIESLTKDLDAATEKKDQMKLNAQIKLNEQAKANAERQQKQMEEFTAKVEDLTDDQVKDIQNKMDEMKEKADKIAEDLK
ncbi:hypothetical protein [Vibrio algivorus]|uniref:Uncharacterized protein n=1 Tax=Vibrio algivorus TaxID=1667024 RepID=A0A557P1N1_9VIBR|nr:hypothetical protein [Vibrio algivorus]TVO34539.1 hypothetical protein FOF44_13345 [Vibrio algivorus]